LEETPLMRISFCGRVLRELHPRRGILTALAASLVIFGLGHAALALAAGLLGRALVRNAPDPTSWAQEILGVCLIGLLGALVKAAAGIFVSYCEVSLAGRVGTRLRGRVARALLAGGLTDTPPKVHATIAVRIREIEGATQAGVVSGLRAMAQLVPLACALILVSPRLAMGGVLVLVPFGLGIAALRRRWRGQSARAQSLVEELHTGVDELVGGLDLWRSYGAGERVERALSDVGERATRAQARVDAARAALSGANEVLGALALLGAVSIAMTFGLPLGDGTLIAFAAVFFMAYRPLRDLGDSRAWSARGADAFAAIDAISQHATAMPARARQTFPLATLEADGFGASSRGPRTSFRVAPGEIVCVLGPTGSGKTTLLRALLGLEAAAGKLVYADRELTHAEVGPGARPFAWVPQDAPLVTGTILDNVALFAGDPGAAHRALAAIGAGELRAHAGAVVGPGGRALSGGERRQVAIARALASELPVLLLDEPTEGLDAQAEAEVLSALSALRHQRSLVIVSHRPAVAEIASRLIALGEPSELSAAAE
jgi:ABC-type multidrug transport system fused ATPase/permease subunit